MDYVRAEEEQGRKYPAGTEVLDDIAINSGMQYPLLNPLLVRHQWIRYLIGAVVIFVLTIFPVIMIIEKTMEWRSGQAGPQGLIFWIFYLVICWGAFLRIIRYK